MFRNTLYAARTCALALRWPLICLLVLGIVIGRYSLSGIALLWYGAAVLSLDVIDFLLGLQRR
jgi:hypothetical protein